MARPIRFRTTRRRRPFRRSLWWLVLLLALAATLYINGGRLGPPERLDEVTYRFGLCGQRGGSACVIDGDTVAIGQRRVRLTGFDAPEMDGACDAERAQARMARTALHAWLAQGPFTWTGGTEPPRDRYGRELRAASRGEETLAEHMIVAGLAEGNGWDEGRDWCD